jgi:hypothetical protein
LNNNIVIGLSKTTRIGLLNRLSQVLYACQNIPSYLDVNRFVSPFLSKVEGHIVLSRFSEDGHPYRVDISLTSNVNMSLSFLSANDSFYHGYPETLRIAHHLSIFTATQVDSIKSYLVQNGGVLELSSENLRQTSLGKINFKYNSRN